MKFQTGTRVLVAYPFWYQSLTVLENLNPEVDDDVLSITIMTQSFDFHVETDLKLLNSKKYRLDETVESAVRLSMYITNVQVHCR